MNTLRHRILVKISNRIKHENYNSTIYEISNMVQSFKDTKRHYDIKGNDSVKVGTVTFNFQNQLKSIDIFVANSPNLFFEAGFDNNIVSGNPKLVVNLSKFKSDYVADKLIPYISHEFTHYLESLYSPAQQQVFTSEEYADGNFKGFYGECLKAIQADPAFKINFGNFSSLKNKDIESVSRYNALKFIKSKSFSSLCSKYNITPNNEIIGKIIKMTRSSYIEDLNFYLQTGGDPFGLSKDEGVNKTKEQSRKIYYNSNTEISGHLSQIISELRESLDLDFILADLIRGKKNLTKELPNILNLSKTFKEINKELTDKNLLFIYKEVARFIMKNSA